MKRRLILASLFFAGTASTADPLTAITAERRAELENMLVQDCGSCHGLRFRGGLGPALLPETLQGKPREFIITSIMQGRAGTAMPPWKNLLNEQEAGWMTDRLLRGFADPPLQTLNGEKS